MTKVINFLLLFTCLLINIFAEPSISNFQECSPKEIVISHGKCSLYVNELIFLSEEYSKDDIPLEAANNMSRACHSITSCFGGLQCLESQKNKELYQKKCDKLLFKNFEIEDCMEVFYKGIYEKNISCVNHFNYSAKTFELQREAYTSGKSCFLSFVQDKCSERTLSFLESNYEQFLNILTVLSQNGSCTPIQNTLLKKQCEPIMLDVAENMFGMSSLFSDTTKNKSLSSACYQVADCLKGPCSDSDDNIKKINSLCGAFEVMEDKEFMDCNRKVKTIYMENKEKLSGYKCIAAMNSTTFKDKNCMKEMMEGECDESVVKNFDEKWDMVDNALLA